jgi:outer membrane protein insertion porin family
MEYNMQARPISFALSVLAAFSSGTLYAQEAPKKAYVGEVIIVGNTITQDRVIREQVDLWPGQVLRYPELRLAEKNLARLGIFKFDPGKGIRPTVQVIETPGHFKDILVKVEETVTGEVRFKTELDPLRGPLARLTIEERNFDLLGWPRSFADFSEGRAFRGAGQDLRLEITLAWHGLGIRFGRPPAK